MPEKKKNKKLKPKEKEFAKKYVANNKNGTKTVKEVYGIKDDKYASVKSARLIGNDSIKDVIVKEELSLKKALIQQGITPEKIANKIDVLLNATSDVYEDGDVVGQRKDYTAINNGLKHAKDIYGVEDPDSNKVVSNTYQFFHNPTFQQNLQGYDQNFKEQVIKQQNAKTIETTSEDVETDG